jgi:hypothetical protein
MARTKQERITSLEEQIAELEKQKRSLFKSTKRTNAKSVPNAFVNGMGFSKIICPTSSPSPMNSLKCSSSEESTPPAVAQQYCFCYR